MTLSVLIPVFNEEKTVLELVSRVMKTKLPAGFKKEIILVDDGSTDSTWKVLQTLKKRKKSFLKIYQHRKNQGKGAALRTALKHTTGGIILIQDADLEYDPKQYSKLLKPFSIPSVLVVYGTRLGSCPFTLFGPKRTPLFSHYLGNKLLTFITNLLYDSSLTDMETCYKLFRKQVIEDMTLESNRFDFEPEITAKILMKGIKIHEVPISVHPRGYDEGKKISWVDGISALKCLFKYRFKA